MLAPPRCHHRPPQERRAGTDEGRQQQRCPDRIAGLCQRKPHRHRGIESHVADDSEIAAKGRRRPVPGHGAVEAIQQPIGQDRSESGPVEPVGQSNAAKQGRACRPTTASVLGVHRPQRDHLAGRRSGLTVGHRLPAIGHPAEGYEGHVA